MWFDPAGGIVFVHLARRHRSGSPDPDEISGEPRRGRPAETPATPFARRLEQAALEVWVPHAHAGRGHRQGGGAQGGSRPAFQSRPGATSHRGVCRARARSPRGGGGGGVARDGAGAVRRVQHIERESVRREEDRHSAPREAPAGERGASGARRAPRRHPVTRDAIAQVVVLGGRVAQSNASKRSRASTLRRNVMRHPSRMGVGSIGRSRRLGGSRWRGNSRS